MLKRLSHLRKKMNELQNEYKNKEDYYSELMVVTTQQVIDALNYVENGSL